VGGVKSWNWFECAVDGVKSWNWFECAVSGVKSWNWFECAVGGVKSWNWFECAVGGVPPNNKVLCVFVFGNKSIIVKYPLRVRFCLYRIWPLPFEYQRRTLMLG